jgi:uracil-DNA glycosylase
MSLALDNRQRAMLREMGVRLWQPPPLAVAAPPDSTRTADARQSATDLIAAHARNTSASGINDSNVAAKTVAAPALRDAPGAAFAPTRPSPPAATGHDVGTAVPGWQLGAAQTLYANAAAPEAGGKGPRWLLLAETPAASLRKPVFDPFDGDAGKLLGNMLRATGLHKSGQPGEAGDVLLAPLARLAAGGVSPAALPDELATLIAQTRPDVIVVMGRLAAQAVLQSSEPLGRLRGQVHQLHGAKTVVTYDAAVLLRSPLDKAKAWEDLCLAIEVSQRLR